MDINVIAGYAWREGLHVRNWRQELYDAVRQRIDRDPTMLDIQYDTAVDADTGRYTTALEVTVDGVMYSYRGVPQHQRTAAIRCVSWMALVDLQQRNVLRIQTALTA